MKKQPTAPSVAEFYHRQTNYSPENISTFVPDPKARPSLFKDYLSDQVIDLTSDLKKPSLAARKYQESDNWTARFARLLHHTGGITSIHETKEGPFYYRASPSAGGLYPTEIYLLTRKLEGIPSGIHAYSVLRNTLTLIWEGEFDMDVEELCFRHTGAIRAKAFLLFTGVFQKSAWRYRERAYRRILLDTGHLLGNAVAYAPFEGFHVVTIGGFYDAAFNDLLFLDARQEVLLIAAPLIDLEDIRDTRINSPFPFPSLKNPHDYSRVSDEGIMRFLHRRSEIVPEESLLTRVPSKPLTLARKMPAEDQETIFLVPETDPKLPQHHIHNLDEVIKNRRSTRSFLREHIPLEALEKVLLYAYEPTVRYWKATKGLSLSNCVFTDPTLLTTYVVILRVDEVRPGVYLYDPEHRSLHLLKAGFFERELHSICLHQYLGRDAAAAIIHTANLPLAVRRYGDRAYRYIHIDAGHLGQRINIAAIGSGIGVSGIGGFFDDEVNELLDMPAASITAYITVLGSPEAPSM